jgi:hypothetical protein
MQRRELHCPFHNLGQAIQRAQGGNCPAHCKGQTACCKLRGHANKLLRLTNEDAAQLGMRSAILRSTKLTRASMETEKLLEGAFLAKMMGRLDIGPKVHAMWLSTYTSQVSMVTEEYTPLTTLLNRTRSSLIGVEESLLRRIDAVARLGIVLLDIHPGNVLISEVSEGRYDALLTDFDMKFVHQAEYLTHACRKLVMLVLFAVSLSCGFSPRLAFVNSIAAVEQSVLRRDRCLGSPADLLGRVQNAYKGEGEWSSLGMALKAHVMSLMKRVDVMPHDSPCRQQGNFTLAHFGILRTVRRLPLLNLAAL